MRIAIGNDRNGIAYKEKLMKHLQECGHEVVNCGTDENIPADYPIYAKKVGELIAEKDCKMGILICATGIGMSVAANKIRGARAGIAYTDEVAKLMRLHNDANIIVFGQDYMEYAEVERRTDIFLITDFCGDYHNTRLKQIEEIENGGEIFQTPIINKDHRHRKGE